MGNALVYFRGEGVPMITAFKYGISSARIFARGSLRSDVKWSARVRWTAPINMCWQREEVLLLRCRLMSFPINSDSNICELILLTLNIYVIRPSKGYEHSWTAVFLLHCCIALVLLLANHLDYSSVVLLLPPSKAPWYCLWKYRLSYLFLLVTFIPSATIPRAILIDSDIFYYLADMVSRKTPADMASFKTPGDTVCHFLRLPTGSSDDSGLHPFNVDNLRNPLRNIPLPRHSYAKHSLTSHRRR